MNNYEKSKYYFYKSSQMAVIGAILGILTGLVSGITNIIMRDLNINVLSYFISFCVIFDSYMFYMITILVSMWFMFLHICKILICIDDRIKF